MGTGHHHSHAGLEHDARSTLTRRAAMFSVSVATILLVVKSYAAWRTGSTSVLGSLADTSLDLVASLVTLMAVRIAAAPSDHDHRFGHGKAEAIAALFQVMLITVSAVAILWRSIHQLTSKAAPVDVGYGIGVSVFAMLLTLALISYQTLVVRKTGSVAIRADHMHYQSDLLLNAAVIAALALEAYAALRGADAVFGAGIGLWLAYGAWQSARHAIDQLMDREWPIEKREQFLAIAAAHPELRGIHDLRTRSSGSHDFVQFHVWVDPAMTVAQAHHIMDEVEAKLKRQFPRLDIVIHPDPAGHVDSEDTLAERDAHDLIAEEKEQKA